MRESSVESGVVKQAGAEDEGEGGRLGDPRRVPRGGERGRREATAGEKRERAADEGEEMLGGCDSIGSSRLASAAAAAIAGRRRSPTPAGYFITQTPRSRSIPEKKPLSPTLGARLQK